MQRFIILFAIAWISCCISCKNNCIASSVYISNQMISEGYIGNGAEWNPYQLN